LGGHLARLATRPDFQRLGIGTTLLHDLLTQFVRRGALRITVNTQQDNKHSISIYEKAGFVRTGEAYPVYLYENN
jgi:ribosomal protein S18 acetylase RimI-like enzyme